MPLMKMKKIKRRSAGKKLPKGEHRGVELLLIQNVEHLGRSGDVVEVKPGYAKNYLIPQGLATIATDHHKRMVEKHRAKLQQIENQRLSTLRSLAAKLAQQSVTVEANANDEGHLYGSVGPTEIVASLKKNDISIAADQVRLDGPLKELGLYTVKVHVAQDIDTELKVWVVPSVSAEEKEKKG
jgi:large subunit ribosomal protein L9